MPKYYVSSGEFMCAIDRADPRTAAIDAFQTLDKNPVKALSRITLVSEHGFDSKADDDVYFCTVDILEQSNQILNFKPEDWT